MNTELILTKIKEFPIAVAGVVVALIAGVIFFIRGGTVPELEAEMNRAQDTLRVVSQNRNQSIGLKQDVEKLRAFISEMEAQSFDSAERAANINYFYGFEADADIRIISIGQGGAITPRTKGKAPFTELKLHAVVPVEMEAMGTFKDLLTYAHRIRIGDKLARIHSLDFTAGSALETEMTLKATFEILGEYLGK